MPKKEKKTALNGSNSCDEKTFEEKNARKVGFDIDPDRRVVRILRCGRSNPGSNPGLDRVLFCTVDGKSPSRRNNRITGTNSDNEKTAEKE